MSKSKGKVVVLGSLATLAIGAVAGVLLAPGKGSQTRMQIKDKTNQYMNTLKSKFFELRNSLTRKPGITKNDVENLAKKGKAKYDYTKNEVKNVASDFKQSVE